jgi:glycolate oxidase FAD binding subunit
VTLPRETAASLRGALGPDVLSEHDPIRVDGEPIGASLRPADTDALAASLEALGCLSVPAVVRGGASGLGLGNPPRGARVFLSTERLAGIDELDAGEGVCHARAGTPLAHLRERAAACGWELPLDPPGQAATLGGALAAAAVGPRALGFGLPRDLVLGLEVVLATGERTRCGGRVVKNVTGYDLNMLYTGSLGTLGVIAGAWIRLRPRPEASALLEAEPGGLEQACAAGLAAARRASARAAALELPGRGTAGARLVVELAGDAASVGRDAAWLAEAWGARAAPADALDELRARPARAVGESRLRFRLAALAARLRAALAPLRAAGADLLAHPGLGLVYAEFARPEGDAAASARAFEAVAAAARAGGGGWRLERGAPEAKRGRDVFGGAGPELRLLRALKQRFDPQGLLNPGRFAGFL